MTGVCILKGGGTAIKTGLHPGGHLHLGESASRVLHLGRGFASRGSASKGSGRALQDMVNKQEVRILLECILVLVIVGRILQNLRQQGG